MNLEHVKHNFTCEISHVKNHMFQIHMFNFTHVKSCGIFVRVYFILNVMSVCVFLHGFCVLQNCNYIVYSVCFNKTHLFNKEPENITLFFDSFDM